MNRKLIRPNLGEIKEKIGRGVKPRPTEQKGPPSVDGLNGQGNGGHNGSGGARRKSPPPDHTNAETYYYVKQMQSKTPIVVVLQDGEKIKGVIEWYDKNCLKINRAKEPNILLPKHNIKYLYKQEDEPKARRARAETKEGEDASGGAGNAQ